MQTKHLDFDLGNEADAFLHLELKLGRCFGVSQSQISMWALLLFVVDRNRHLAQTVGFFGIQCHSLLSSNTRFLVART